jgi:ABC-type hemin transport system ATPase subunit
MVLVVTHDPRLMPYADRVFQLDDGLLTRVGQPNEILERDEVSDHTPLPLPFRKGPRLSLYVPHQELAQA